MRQWHFAVAAGVDELDRMVYRVAGFVVFVILRGEAHDQLHRPQVLAVHGVDAVLAFHDGHERTGAVGCFDKVDLVGSRVAQAVAACREIFLGGFLLLLKAECSSLKSLLRARRPQRGWPA